MLRIILTELDGVPNIGSDELNDARDSAIELQLTNRFAHVKGMFIDLVLDHVVDDFLRSTGGRESALGAG